MSLTGTVPSEVAFDLSLATGLSAWVSRVRELVAPSHVPAQGRTLSTAGSEGTVRGLGNVELTATVCETIMPSPIASGLVYTQQPVIKGAFKSVRPGVRTWSPPD